MIRIKIISPIEKRKDQFLTNVIENVNKEIRQMYFPDKFLQKLKQNCFYAITNAKIGTAINVSQYSKVMESKPFPYDVEVEKAFLHPPIASVAEALASPSKRRLSLSGRSEGVEDEEEDPSAIMEGEVETACFDESDSSIILCGKCLAIDTFLLGEIFKEGHYVENVHVKVRQEAKRVEKRSCELIHV
ncbi:unnamed protein product [Mytilus edulis]|uniref:Uncharacterized protein n=1 Tax=Mytilus edulis TaxID=6550 RepID=A0A8S3VKW9_MYTED|nr:unnamed protein product [Mytilus edulis]